MISRVKGTQDILDLTLYNFAIDLIRGELARYAFTEIATPIIEPTDLFVRSLGSETDVVTKEMFLITPRSPGDQICLRPEATASTVRAFVQNGIAQTPWKVFSYGPMFRYERPQKGRYRQFHQITIEVIASAATSEDVQLITMLDRIFHEKFSCNNYALHINFLGCTTDRHAYVDQLRLFLQHNNMHICQTCQHRSGTNPLRVFDCKHETCQAQYRTAPKIVEHLCDACAKEWKQVQDQLRLLSVSFVCNPTLVRGLDYYNKTVFEFVSEQLGAQNAFCAGGRYDQLVGYISGGPDQPSVGAAIGLDRLMLMLEPLKGRLPLIPAAALHIIIPLSAEQESLALLLADELYAAGLTTDILFEGSLKGNLRRAHKRAARYVLLLGEEEQQNHDVLVKHMITGAQLRMKQSAVVDYLRG